MLAELRLEYDWTHTANMMAQQANMWRGKNDSPVSPADFMPFRQKPKPVKGDITLLKSAFVRERKPING